MAFTASPAIRNSISRQNTVVCDVSDNTGRDRFSFHNNLGIYKGQRNLHNHLTTANVATPLPVTAPPPDKLPGTTTGGRQHHVAWTSIPQERWEGELLVQGQIPLWLVSGLFSAEFLNHNFFLIISYTKITSCSRTNMYLFNNTPSRVPFFP